MTKRRLCTSASSVIMKMGIKMQRTASRKRKHPKRERNVTRNTKSPSPASVTETTRPKATMTIRKMTLEIVIVTVIGDPLVPARIEIGANDTSVVEATIVIAPEVITTTKTRDMIVEIGIGAIETKIDIRGRVDIIMIGERNRPRGDKGQTAEIVVTVTKITKKVDEAGDMMMMMMMTAGGNTTMIKSTNVTKTADIVKTMIEFIPGTKTAHNDVLTVAATTIPSLLQEKVRHLPPKRKATVSRVHLSLWIAEI
mmetsp:Transcript_64405/g.180071  ORF Transcript_64405/g.180071 Transcript_64405/m.180071 type:complete len:254 (-) Transcript_64405:11-772(-)